MHFLHLVKLFINAIEILIPAACSLALTPGRRNLLSSTICLERLDQIRIMAVKLAPPHSPYRILTTLPALKPHWLKLNPT